jgi:hypothetical protein
MSPTTKRIIWTKPSGEVVVTVPCAPMLEGETEQEYLDRVAARAQAADPTLADCTRAATVENASVPARRWRAGWRVAAGAVVASLPACRLVRLVELIKRRVVLILILNEKIETAVDNGQNVLAAALRAKRKSIRDLDLTAALQAVADLATLDTYEPAEFGGVE